jgi:hypothetical protein
MKNVADLAALVTTAVGDIPQDELAITTTEEDGGDVWIMARECVYKGTAHPEVYDQIVRRDVWVTMKTGQAASAVAPS